MTPTQDEGLREGLPYRTMLLGSDRMMEVGPQAQMGVGLRRSSDRFKPGCNDLRNDLEARFKHTKILDIVKSR
jgi:hypothetical protein